MRNIITTSCLGGYTYRNLKIPYGNPFIWTRIEPDQFNILVDNYNNIDLSNVKFTIEPSILDPAIHGDVVWANVDGMVKMMFLHHHVRRGNRFFCRIVNNFQWNERMVDYVRDKWFKRVRYMDGEPPIFVMDYFLDEQSDFSEIDHFMQNDGKVTSAPRFITTVNQKAFEYSVSRYGNERVYKSRSFNDSVRWISPKIQDIHFPSKTVVQFNGDGQQGRTCLVYIANVKSISFRTQFILSLKSFLHFYRTGEKPMDIYVITNDSNIVNGMDFGQCRCHVIDLKTDVRQKILTPEQLEFIDRLQDDSLFQSAIYKIAIPSMPFFHDYDNVLYVDSDTLFMSDGIFELFQVPALDSQIVGVDEEVFGEITHDRYSWMKLNHKYVNSGVLLFKPQNFDDEGYPPIQYVDRAIELYCMDSRYRLTIDNLKIADQCIINRMFKIKSIGDYRFNNYGGCNVENPIINHYIGDTKRGQVEDFKKLNND